METLIEKEQKRYIKKFHTLLGKVGGGDMRKEAILWRLGVEHTTELSVEQLIGECNALYRELNPKLDKLENARNRLIASISAYHKVMGMDIFQKDYRECTPYEKAKRIRYAKGTAERAASREEFNSIPLEQLRSLYGKFTRAVKDVIAVDGIISNDMLHRVSLN